MHSAGVPRHPAVAYLFLVRLLIRPAMKLACVVVFLLWLVGCVLHADSCGSFRDARGCTSVDVAPLPGFVDVCSRDFQLCVMLTQGFPPSVQTIGYFVPVEEWERYQTGQHKGFSRYLIAQKARTLSAEDFAGFKRYVHSQNGNIPDHTKLASLLESHGQVSLGIVDETSDSISIGTLARLTSQLLNVMCKPLRSILPFKSKASRCLVRVRQRKGRERYG